MQKEGRDRGGETFNFDFDDPHDRDDGLHFDGAGADVDSEEEEDTLMDMEDGPVLDFLV